MRAAVFVTPMNPERWQRIESLCQGALELDPRERTAFLERECAEDASLRREVEELLQHHGTAGHFIDSPAEEVVAKLIVGDRKRSWIGRRIRHYQVESLLGAGGMGEVYLAQDTVLGRNVALKLLPEQFTQDPERVRRFEKEARAASALNHPNIVVIHEIGRVDQTYYIATEFIEGETLRARLDRSPMDLRSALDVAAQVAGALSAAHAAGVVHCDIKPENIMIRPDGYVKVLDFGLAKLVRAHPPEGVSTVETDLSLTREGTLLGTRRKK